MNDQYHGFSRAEVTDDEPHCRAQTARVYPGAPPGEYSCRRQYRAMVTAPAPPLAPQTNV